MPFAAGELAIHRAALIDCQRRSIPRQQHGVAGRGVAGPPLLLDPSQAPRCLQDSPCSAEVHVVIT